MGRKHVIYPFTSIDTDDLSTEIIGKITSVAQTDKARVSFEYSGTGIRGEFILEYSHDQKDWAVLDFQEDTAVHDDSGNYLFLIESIPAPFIRPKFIPTAGTGNIKAVIWATSLGA